MTQSKPVSIRKHLTLFIASLCLVLSYTVVASAATVELTGTEGSVVKLNDMTIGVFPLKAPLVLPPGTYTVSCFAPGHTDYSHTFRLSSDDDILRLRVRMTPMTRKQALICNVPLAGLGQFYMGKKTKGWVFLTAETGGLLTALLFELQRSDYNADYDMLKHEYDTSISAVDAVYYREKAGLAYQDMTDARDIRNLGLIVAGSAWLLSMLDAYFTFPDVDTGIGPISPQTSWNNSSPFISENPMYTVHASVRLSF